MVSVWVALPAAAFNERVLPFWIHESHSIRDKKAGQCGESIKSLLSAGVSTNNSSRVTAWLNSHTPAKSPISIIDSWGLALLCCSWPEKGGRGSCFSKTNQTLKHCVSKCIHPPLTVSLDQRGFLCTPLVTLFPDF